MSKIVKIYKLKNELNLRRSLNQDEVKRGKENYIIKNNIIVYEIYFFK
ncbi:MAG: hypothetical protein ACRCXY_04210 [Fusobacteriaceae bacterium]